MTPSTPRNKEASRGPETKQPRCNPTEASPSGRPRVWIDGQHSAAEYGDETARIAVGPGIESHPVFATSVVYLVKRHVKVGLRCRQVSTAILHHSHNARFSNHPASGTGSRPFPCASREGFVDDHDATYVFVVLRPEIASSARSGIFSSSK